MRWTGGRDSDASTADFSVTRPRGLRGCSAADLHTTPTSASHSAKQLKIKPHNTATWKYYTLLLGLTHKLPRTTCNSPHETCRNWAQLPLHEKPNLGRWFCQCGKKSLSLVSREASRQQEPENRQEERDSKDTVGCVWVRMRLYWIKGDFCNANECTSNQ